MSYLPLTADFRSIILGDIPLIDVRAPVEFARGAFPGAVNLPLMNDEERRLVGTCYTHEGHEAAVALGHRLVNAQVRAPRIDAWAQFTRTHENALLYCFRGGMRSQISQQWLFDHHGIVIPRLEGGYKALRRYLLEQLEQEIPAHFAARALPLVLAGRTGTGKTILIRQMEHAIDLEDIAHHRGSAFGRYLTPQPSQIDFENRLAWKLIQLLHRQPGQVIFEDESQAVGAVNIPAPFFEVLKNAARVVVESSLEERIERTVQEYVTESQQRYAESGDLDCQRWKTWMHANFHRIRKRLGMERYGRVAEAFDRAMVSQEAIGIPAAHREWVRIMLSEYYDPMYDYQMERAASRVLFRGPAEQVLEFLAMSAQQRHHTRVLPC
ncbi:tRNA 2-selenouridine synthase [Desulfurispirillum indicum S5]|uniref:tRNA 2-selenouridine synthase n=1 Tax=Desulfurispirillum indicum (strain ATCC BAA-1389 / DSM 22839 / S5) TaxID=653733 RepID=E6W369_DESIS|nr:tRNA 2-selenouridine(34) synthase MnmH [Desulfurispirillum indicum]ADU65730.1 tRNA 2-selenouridine synthase [Desulfurispirillum indicum S5]